ncbi:MAG: serine protease [Chitinispirillia bacterium]|nr:serine protease [Chitinispirillia bacterium]
MNTKRIALTMYLLLLLLYVHVSAQLSTNEFPISFKYNFSKETVPTIVMPTVDTVKLKEEDTQEVHFGLPPRFGFMHTTNLNLTKEGKWHVLENGDKLWQLAIVCPDALTINLLYDKFWLPPGAKFFIYSQDKKHHIGAFTEINNKGTKDKIQGFATGLIRGNAVMLEYYLPKNSTEEGIISISGVVHGYKPTIFSNEYGFGTVPRDGFGLSGSCQVNINCSEGTNWQNEKRAIALITINGVRNCTGALINNTNNDFHPYFLTADHCLRAGQTATENPNLYNWMFYWNYELSGCNNSSVEPLAFSTSGANVLANWSHNNNLLTGGSDFALLELTENPVQLSTYTPPFMPYYLGWDRTGNVPSSGVGIHHPQGDVKKISTLNNIPGTYGNYWDFFWSPTTNGFSVTEGGSSGSPFINSSRRVIGQLQGGSNINCNMPVADTARYGKFNISWNGGGVSTNRLSNWLHSSNTSAPNILDGIGYCRETTISKIINQNETVKCDKINVINTTVMPTGKLTLIGGSSVNIIGDFNVHHGAELIIRANP